MRINFDFADLEAFLVLSETASFVAAARHLGLSQSTLTRRIRRLEEELGTALFERTTRSVRPTFAARRFRARAQAMLDDARETLREMQDETARHHHQISAIVTVATVPSAIPRLLIPAAGLFATGGRARLRILDLLANEVADAVLSGAADFGVSSHITEDPGLRFTTLLDDRIVLAVPRGHPLSRPGPVRWREIAPHRLILPTRGSGNRALIDRALARHRLTLFWSVEAARTASSLEMVRAGIGVAPLPLAAVPLGDSDGYALRELTEPEVTRRFGLVTRQTGTLAADAARLRDMVVSRATSTP